MDKEYTTTKNQAKIAHKQFLYFDADRAADTVSDSDNQVEVFHAYIHVLTNTKLPRASIAMGQGRHVTQYLDRGTLSRRVKSSCLYSSRTSLVTITVINRLFIIV